LSYPLKETWLLYLLAAILGLILGSFLTMLTHRLPLILEGKKGLSLSYPPSHCPHCNNPIPFYFNIPLIGYFLCLGHCRKCKQPISLLYPFTELSSLLLACLAVWLWGGELKSLSAIFLWCSLLALSIIDFRSGYLPDQLTLSLLWLGLLFNTTDLWVDTSAAIWGACLGYLALATINSAYKMIRRRDGLGGGDMKLYASLGAFVGWQGLIPILFIASISACCFTVCWLLLKRTKITQVAFGPFLAIAVFLYMIFTY